MELTAALLQEPRQPKRIANQRIYVIGGFLESRTGWDIG